MASHKKYGGGSKLAQMLIQLFVSDSIKLLRYSTQHQHVDVTCGIGPKNALSSFLAFVFPA